MKNILFAFLIILGIQQPIFGQQPLLLKVDSLFNLAQANSKMLDASRYKINMAEKATEIEKQKTNLPNIDAAFSYAYLSNGHVWDNGFNYENTVKMPHTSLDLSVEASYLVFDGNASKNRIAKAGLEEQIAQLNFDKDKEDIQFLLLAKYLDLAALYNQENVVKENINLAEKRISNIKKLIEQGMLTHNDQVRSELLLTELQEKLSEIRNNANIVNHELVTITGLPKETIIKTDSVMLSEELQAESAEAYQSGFENRLPELKAANIKSQIAEKQEAVVKSGRLPKVSLFAGDALSRPFLYSIPPQDIYLHLFQAGVKVQYDITSLYKSKNLVQQAEMEKTLSQKNEAVLAEKAEIAIHAAYVKLEDAKEKYNSQKESYRLAKDNYRVVEQKYLNKFAVITDMVDASNALLSAQINVNNARIGIMYQYYQLMKTSGRWDEVNH